MSNIPAYDYEKKVVDPKDRKELETSAYNAGYHYHNQLLADAPYAAGNGPHPQRISDELRKHHAKMGAIEGARFKSALKVFHSKYDHPLGRWEQDAHEEIKNGEEPHAAAYSYITNKNPHESFKKKKLYESELQNFVKNFLVEAITRIPDSNNEYKGVEELHSFEGGHKVYVKIAHHGEGHHKVTALYVAPGQDKGTVARKDIKAVPSNIRRQAVTRTFGTVKEFMKHNDWNSIALGGSDAKNKALYRSVGDSIAASSGGKIRSEHIVGAGVRMRKTEMQPMTANHTPITPPNAEMDKYRKQAGSSGSNSAGSSKSNSGSSRPEGISGDLKSHPVHGKFGMSGSKGPFKIDATSAKESKKSKKSAADSGESAGASEVSSGSSAAS